jgi:hypothetical protein
MKNLRIILVSTALASLTACAQTREIINSDTNSSGGAVGYLVDHKTSYGSNGNKKMQVYRAVVGLALIARVGEATLRDGRDVDAFMLYMTNVSDSINDLAGHIYGANTCTDIRSTTACKDYEQLFETDLPRLEGDMVKLGVAALPRREGAKFLASVSSGNPLGIASSVWKLSSKVVVAGHSAASTARSEREIFAAIATKNGQSVGNVEAAIKALEVYKVDANFDLKKQDLEPLYFHIRNTCRNLAYDLSGSKKTAQETQNARETACKAIKFEPKDNRYS